MTNHDSAAAGCVMIGEYGDEAECPPDLTSHRGEVVRPQVVAYYLDLWGRDDSMREFTVLLKDGRVVAVRGHGLKYEPHPGGGGDVLSVIVRTGEGEVLVALFTSHDVSGIFCGEVRADRRIA